MGKFIPLSVPNLKGNELKYVANAIEQEWVSTNGSYINRFEKEMARYLKVETAVACQSGTAGLHLALQLCGVGYNDEVIVPTLTFIAAVNPVRYLGANPVFMDCDDSLTIDVEKLKEFLTTNCEKRNDILINKKSNRIIKAIIAVHVFGNISNMQEIMELAEEYNLKVVEDATEALGTYYKSGIFKESFAGTIGDFGVYSFNGNKIITTGGGGMIVGRDSKLVGKAKYLSTQSKDDELYYVHNEIGYNYRMNNLQAALGVAQLENLEAFIKVKRRNYDLYKNQLKDVEGLDLLEFKKDIRANYWFYSLIINNKKFKFNRDQLLNYLKNQGIQSRPIWGLIHQQKPYLNCEAYRIEKALYYRDKVLNIPCSTNLSEEDLSVVISILKGVMY